MPFVARDFLHSLLQLVAKPDLLRAVYPIANQRLIDRLQTGEGGSDNANPFVMNPAFSNGQEAVSQAGAEHYRSAGHKPVFRQDDILSGQQRIVAYTRETEPLPQCCT